MNADEVISRRTDTLITRQPTNVQRNIEARLCNHFCSGKVISISYCECVFVALGIQHAMHMHLIVISGLPYSTIFFHIITQTAVFSGKMLLNIKYVFGLPVQFLSEKNYHSKKN